MCPPLDMKEVQRIFSAAQRCVKGTVNVIWSDPRLKELYSLRKIEQW